ncbi:DNA excision repair protein [Patellaria atrata CBS 101060]|uniref:DNA excision repair protein n=1 Tax=Patellaria atrata CBS 101060 TaxID=1346257 RepID=A0A9P4VPK2_9PEZI|nr:DNA excision repair protein [Patellaria atrata CBS 101060]
MQSIYANLYLNADAASEDDSSTTVSDADDSHDPSFEKAKIEFSDDEDPEAAYAAFKNRKSVKRKRVAAEVKKVKARVQADSKSKGRIVGKKSRIDKLKDANSKDPLNLKKIVYGDGDDTKYELMDETMPDYIKDRKVAFEKRQERLGASGLRIPPDVNDIYFSDDDNLESLEERPRIAKSPLRKYEDIIMKRSGGIIPAPIACRLRDYQIEGVEFLHEIFVWQRGGILGDDMGLGKTIQIISFLTAAFGKTGDQRDEKRMRKIRRALRSMHKYPRVLIICPGTLMNNWQSELKKWGWWHVYVYHSTSGDKEAALEAARSGRVEIVITTYTTYKKNKSAINTIDWDAVIADECHVIKSRHSEVTQAMNEINALCRIGLTGTAIQNKYDELWTLLNWTNPGRFGSLASWQLQISDPLKYGQAHDATLEQLAKARKTARKLVQNLLPRFFLRRTKSLIADQLPKKSDRVVFCPLTDTQADAYENLVNSDIIEYIRTSSEVCPCESGKRRGWCCYTDIPGFGKWQNHVFPSMVLLQKLSNHLAQLIPASNDLQEKQTRDMEALQIAVPHRWKELYRQKDNIMNFADQDFCGKWKILKKLLTFWYSNGDKVLVFSHSVRLLKMFRMLFASTTSYNVSYLDGAMQYDDRTRAVDDFNNDPSQFVFLISTKAGGVGLNITSANKVVIIDPNWNPAYDLQAQDRAYRIGQERDVEVFRLVSAGAIEEIIYARQIYKQQQANIGYNASNERRYFKGVQDKASKKGEIFGLANMFSFHGDSVVMRNIVNQTNVAEAKKAGVQIIGFDVDEDDEDEADENSGMSQVAELIAAGMSIEDQKKQKTMEVKRADPVQAILASAGVQYTHENSEVIGTSNVETKLSKQAEEVGNDPGMDKRTAFDFSQTQRCELDLDGESGDDEFEGDVRDLKDVTVRYHPPEDVRKRQFCTMAKTFGFEDAVDFALVVEGWTQEQRRNCLDKFYRVRKKEVISSQEKN